MLFQFFLFFFFFFHHSRVARSTHYPFFFRYSSPRRSLVSVGTQAFLIGCVVDNDGGGGLLLLLLLLVGTASEKGTYHRHYDPHPLSFINFFVFF